MVIILKGDLRKDFHSLIHDYIFLLDDDYVYNLLGSQPYKLRNLIDIVTNSNGHK